MFLYIYGKQFTKYLHGPWFLLNILMIFWHKRKIDNFDSHNVFLAIAANIPQRFKTCFVLQGHILYVYVDMQSQASITINKAGYLFMHLTDAFRLCYEWVFDYF